MNASDHEEVLLSVSAWSASVYLGHCTGLVQHWPAQKLGLNIEHGSERHLPKSGFRHMGTFVGV